MPSPRKKDLSLAVLVATVVAAAGLLPLAYHYGQERRAQRPDTTVAAVRAPAAAPEAAPAAGPGETETVPPAPPGAEVVPPEESETDRGPASASPSGPALSAGRAAGLHLTHDPLHLNSSAALVVDQDTGQVLAQKNEAAVLPMASLTKLMTTLLVLEAKQPMDEVLTITEEDVDNERHSRSRLRVGTQLTREEALRLALMSSENRAAHALGRSYPGGLPKMVEAMNAKARALGMSNTTYVDPTGLSNRNQSTAHDLATLVAQAAKNPVIRDFSTTPAHVASLNGRTLQYRNSNRLVRSDGAGWDIELQKTGYIVEAGRCLTMLTKVGGHNLVMVLLDADSNRNRLADAQRLRKWVVTQNGWQDEPVLAKAPAEAPRQSVAAKGPPSKAEKLAAAKERKSAQASAGKGAKARTEVASAKKGRKHRKGQDAEVADNEPPEKEAKVAKTGKPGKSGSAARKGRPAKEDAVAKKGEPKKSGRVSKSFASTHAEEKS